MSAHAVVIITLTKFYGRREIMKREISHSQTRAALYMARLLMAGIMCAEHPDFFMYLDFAGVRLKELLRDITKAAMTKPDSPAKSEALDDLRQAQGWRIPQLIRDFNDIIYDNPILRELLRFCALNHCLRISETKADDSENYRLALEKLAGIFCLSPEAQKLLEFAYIVDTEREVSSYFGIGELEIFRPRNKTALSAVLAMNISDVIDAWHEIKRSHLFQSALSITDGIASINNAVYQVFEAPDKDPEDMFCVPLYGETLPLGSFNIPAEDLSYITRLMTSKTNSPVHIMVYGSPGTGKTTFARSLAKSLGLTAWTANTPGGNIYDGRPAAVVACMNIAANHPGSFVVVDEAEKIARALEVERKRSSDVGDSGDTDSEEQ